ncbi:glycosyltransferase family 2 protein [Thermophilibacter immobilis]|uniref:Glycosyltransferase family 2 protein n=1 Tax=Thermophilibacter immobilis TaxID=2779519 RepID=A0A7S7MAC1_9ACTN|nr:glycosyltransferase family 2 protein [Thermophilibacter immobilis]QOY61387.1 glycosyltransferase family 2 protein [Thermophilibacter immobilis]
MRLVASGTCRGSGKVFVRFEAHDLPDSRSVSIKAQTSGTAAVPCSIHEVPSFQEHESRQFVAAFPMLDTRSCQVTLSEEGEAGSILSSQSYALSFSAAKWESRLNYRLRKSLCEEIRDFDRVDMYDSATMEFWDCIEDGPDFILRGMLREPYRTDNKASLRCLTSTLEQIPVNPIIMGDACVKVPFSDTKHRRELQFSIRVPAILQRLVFDITDENHPAFSSFEVLDRPVLRELRDTTRKHTESAQFNPDYNWWFAQKKASIGTIAKESRIELRDSPRFSIVVPLFKTPLRLFNEMVESVLFQSYQSWELVLVNASPEDEKLSTEVRTRVESDERIRLVTLEQNLGISENTNRGIEVVTGDFVCFFDHDDVLEPDILFEYAHALNERRDTDVLYCDEDKLLPDGTYTQPFFKPDFDIDLLRNNNYICHLMTIRRSLLETLEPNRPEFDGAQDHNMVLQAVEKARHVHHVPKVLYHWRMTKGSTAENAGSKSYATKAGIRAVQAHLGRMGLRAKVSPSRRPFTYRVIYDVPEERPLVSIIIPSKDYTDVLDVCLQSILSTSTYENYEIVVIENNSEIPETFSYYERIQQEHPDKIRVEHWPGEFNFSKLMNFGVQKARGEYLLLLNNDTEVITPDWIEVMLGLCSREDVGIVGVRLLYRDSTIQHAGLTISSSAAGMLGHALPRNNWGYFALLDAQRELSAVTAACMMTKRSVFDEAGGYTEELQVAFNDVDYCLKVRDAERLVVYTPEVELYHYESLSRGDENNVEKKVRFHREVSYLNYRWARYFVEGDPYFNPNFTKGEPGSWYYQI